LAASRASGASSSLAASRWRQQRLLILCYHGVSLRDEHLWHPELFVTPEFLRRRFEIIRALGFVVLPLAEAVTRLRAGNLPQRSVALTFDDGFHNFQAAAAPILKQFDYPATVYLSTYHCLHQRPILGLTIPYLLWRAQEQAQSHGLRLLSGAAADLSNNADRAALLAGLLNEARALALDRSSQLQWLESLSNKLHVDWRDFMSSRVMHLMTADEVAAVSSQGLDVQLHTHRHRSPTDKSLFVAEVTENQRLIREMTGRTAQHFCYPSGVVQDEFLPWLRECGVDTATTCRASLATAHTNPLLLPRFIDTMGQSELYFESWLSGVSGWLGRGRSIEI
jgi:peptidoglycan/xylan/chitin deacetylase (PgdA/CDA1 family)